jgi:hypothetical protein
MAFTLAEIENLRRSVAMLPADAANGLTRAKALEVLSDLAEVTSDRDRLRAELAELANLEELLTKGHLFGESRSPEA